MNRAFGVAEYVQHDDKRRNGRRSARSRKRNGRWTALRWAGVLVVTAFALALGLIQTASANPDHSAGDYVIFAKALAEGITVDPKAYEPDCGSPSTSNDGQGQSSGEDNTYFGRIHSNADLILSGANDYADTPSPNDGALPSTPSEITFGTNDGAPPACLEDHDIDSVFDDGEPINITGLAYQVDATNGWPGTIGGFLTQTGDHAFETFPNTNSTSAVGLSCDAIGNAAPGDPLAGMQTTLEGTTTIPIKTEFAENYRNKVICSGTGEIDIQATNLGSAGPPVAPFKITMLSHGLIKVSGQGNIIAPAGLGHGVLAWTDAPFSASPTAIDFSGSDLRVPERSILFAPRSGINVSGSDDDDVCIQAIGQGIVKIAGSNSRFGPFGTGCGTPATVVTQIHADEDHTTDIQGQSVLLGTEIHDKVTVTSTTVPPTNLTGSITVNRYDNGTCTGTAAATATFTQPGDFTVAPTVTLDNVLPFTPPVGTYSYRASYNGDAGGGGNLAATGVCEGPVTVIAPNLTSVKSNNVGGTVNLGDSFTWTITASNGGNGPAVFADTEEIIGDPLPAGATYGTPAVVPASVTNVTNSGNISCSITANVLSCVAAGATVTVGATTGTFAVSFLVTPTAAGDLVNGANICVDPDDVVEETNENDNTCGDTVTTTAPNLTSVKSNNVGGTVNLGDSFTWTITASNGGNGPAVFADTEEIIGDPLPAGATYGTPAVVPASVTNVTNSGNISCSITANVLSCVAAGATVTVGATTGTFAVSFLVTPTAAGDLVNGANICVDPDDVVEETNENDNTCGDTVTTTAPNLTSVKSNNVGGTVNLGDSFTWTITASNGGNGPAVFADTEEIIGDPLPAGATYGTPAVVPASVTNVTNSGNISCSITANVLSCVAAGATVTVGATTGTFAVSFLVTPTAAGDLVNGANICVDPDDVVEETNENDNTCGDTVTTTAPNLTSVKSNNVGGTVNLGDSFTWTITASNGGNGPAVFADTEEIIGDPLPAGATYGTPAVVPASVTNVTNSGNISCSITANVLSCVAAGATVTVGATTGTFAVSFLVTPTAAGDLVNGANICVDPDDVVEETNENDNTCGDTVTTTAPNLTSVKSNNVGGTVNLGDSFTWTITASNGGNGPAVFADTEEIIGDPLPAGATYGTPAVVPASVTNVTNSGNISCSITANVLSCVAAGATVTVGATTGTFAVSFLVTPTAAGDLVNGANICVDPDDVVEETNENDNTCGDTVTTTAPNLTSVKSNNVGGTVNLGDSFTWTITASNGGNGPAVFADTEEIIGDPLPAGATYGTPAVVPASVTNVTNSGNISCSITANVLSCVAAGATVTVGATTGTFAVSFLVTPTAAGDLVNGANICVDPDDVVEETNENDNTCGDTVTTTAPNLTSVKSNNVGGTVNLGDSFTWTITASNGGNGPAVFADTEEIIGDPLPAGATYGTPAVVPASVTNVTNSGNISCSITANVLSCVAAGATVTVGATTGTFAVSFLVTPTAAGDLVNGANICVDPDDVVEETNENDNTCGDTVTVPGEGATLLIIDEDSIDNGIHFNALGGLITPDGPNFFSAKDVNDKIAKNGQRTPLKYFANPDNFDKTITVKTGQTGDEGWFAPTCIPPKWVMGSANLPCLEDAARQAGINAYFGANNVSTLKQSKLDKIPAVMPLRALGLTRLVTHDICAVVYDSDISINYDKNTFPFTSGNLQGATLGIVAFTVESVHTLGGFSSSTLPQVKIKINNPATCNPTELFNAPVPRSSSVPNDINAESPIDHTGDDGYLQLLTHPLEELFF